MTLCLAWKQNSKIYFTSDSRLSNGTSVITDKASKIFKINVIIYGPSNSEKEKIIYTSNFGLCFTGSYLNGSLLADTMTQVLSNLQGAENYSDFSIENLSNISLGVYKQISVQLMEKNRQNGLSEVLFGGYCLENKEFNLFKFGFRVNEEIEFYKEKINLSDLPIYIGDSIAKDKAIELSAKINSNYSYYHLIREIINDNEINSVGGDIQIGIFESNNFDTHGILEYEIEREPEKLAIVKSTFKYRGLKIDYDDLELRSGNINPMISFVNPFESERNSYYKQIMNEIDEDIAKLM